MTEVQVKNKGNIEVNWRELVDFFRPLWRPIGVSFTLSSMSQVSQLLVPWTLGYLVDSISRKDLQMIFIWIATMYLINVAFRFIQYLSDAFEIKNLDFEIKDLILNKVLRKILKLSLGQHYSQNSSYRSSVASKGRDAMHNILTLILYQLFPNIVQLIASMVILITINVYIGLVALLSTALYLFLSFLYDKNIMPDLNDLDELGHKRNKSFNEALRFADLITVNGQKDKVIKEQAGLMESYSTKGKQIWLAHDLTQFKYSQIRIVALTAVVAMASYYVYNGQISVGKLTTIFIIAGQVFGQVGYLAYFLRRFISDLASVNIFTKLMKVESSINDAKNPLNFVNGDIVFENVSFTYPSRNKGADDDGDGSDDTAEPDMALEKINLTIKKGQRVGIVGPSGGGKSTLMAMLLRGYDPSEGRILINGQDLKDIKLKTFLHRVGFVEQRVNLFDHSVRYNLTFGLNGEADKMTDEDLMVYLEKAQLMSLWPKLDKGFDTVIGEKGIKLSGGEGQRLGIARALIKKPEIIIFDEATSNLDAESEHGIQMAVESSLTGMTAIIIAHRLSTVRSCDFIVMVSDGKIIGQGAHEELMKNCPEYQKLVQRQIDSVMI